MRRQLLKTTSTSVPDAYLINVKRMKGRVNHETLFSCFLFAVAVVNARLGSSYLINSLDYYMFC